MFKKSQKPAEGVLSDEVCWRTRVMNQVPTMLLRLMASFSLCSGIKPRGDQDSPVSQCGEPVRKHQVKGAAHVPRFTRFVFPAEDKLWVCWLMMCSRRKLAAWRGSSKGLPNQLHVPSSLRWAEGFILLQPCLQCLHFLAGLSLMVRRNWLLHNFSNTLIPYWWSPVDDAAGPDRWTLERQRSWTALA